MFGLLFSKAWDKLSGRMHSGKVRTELYQRKDTHIYQAIGSVCINSASSIKVSTPYPRPAPLAKIHFSNPGANIDAASSFSFWKFGRQAALCLLPHSLGVL